MCDDYMDMLYIYFASTIVRNQVTKVTRSLNVTEILATWSDTMHRNGLWCILSIFFLHKRTCKSNIHISAFANMKIYYSGHVFIYVI